MESDIPESSGCSIEGKVYPVGAELCVDTLCKVCEEGEFKIPVEFSMNDDDVLADPGEAYFTQGSVQ